MTFGHFDGSPASRFTNDASRAFLPTAYFFFVSWSLRGKNCTYGLQRLKQDFQEQAGLRGPDQVVPERAVPPYSVRVPTVPRARTRLAGAPDRAYSARARGGSGLSDPQNCGFQVADCGAWNGGKRPRAPGSASAVSRALFRNPKSEIRNRVT